MTSRGNYFSSIVGENKVVSASKNSENVYIRTERYEHDSVNYVKYSLWACKQSNFGTNYLLNLLHVLMSESSKKTKVLEAYVLIKNIVYNVTLIEICIFEKMRITSVYIS